MFHKALKSLKLKAGNQAQGTASSRRKYVRRLLLENCEQRKMFATNILVSDFDGRPGNDVAEIRDRSITFVDSSAKATTLKVDNWNRTIVGEVNGQPGNEIILLPGLTSGRAKIQVVSLTAKSVTSFTVDGYANARIEDLDGTGGNEILVFSGISGLNQSVSVLKPTSGTQANYQVKTDGNVWVQDLDGLPGNEVLFDSGSRQSDRTFSVIQSQANRLDRYDVRQTGGWQLMDLDGRAGLEIIVSNLATVNGSPLDADVTVVNYSRNFRTTIDVGRATDLLIRDLDADGDVDLMVHDFGSVTAGASDRTLRVIEPNTGNVTAFNVGRFRKIDFAEFDGTSGAEAILTNLVSINGSPQAASAIIIDFNSLTSRTYDLGRPTDLALQDLDADGALELIATDLNSVSSDLRDRTLTVVTPSRNQVKTFNVGRANNMQFVDLDGGGNELLFTNIVTVNGTPRDSKATVYSHTTGDVFTYDVGKPTRLVIRELDSQPGSELLFTNLGGTNVATTNRSATVVSHRQRTAKTYDVGAVDSYNIRELDGQSGEEVVFVGSNVVSVLIQREARVDIYSMPRLQSVLYTPIDSIPGDELVIRTSNGRFVIYAGLRKVVRA